MRDPENESVELWCKLLHELIEADTGVTVTVQSVHEPLQLALCRVEPVLGQHVAQIASQNEPTPTTRACLEYIS